MTIQQLLTNAGINAAASSNADPSTAITATIIPDLTQALVSQHCYPLMLPDDEDPDEFAIYQPVSMRFIESDGYRLGRIDSYLLSLRAKKFSRAQQLSTDLIDAVANYRGTASLDITDAAADYEHDQKQYRAHLELDTATLAASIQWPAVLIHRIAATAKRDDLATGGSSQSVTEQVAVICIAPESQIHSLRDDVAGAIIGQSSGEYSDTYEYAGGQLIAVAGSIAYWREVYTWRRYLRT
jgi:hypothetical protein